MIISITIAIIGVILYLLPGVFFYKLITAEKKQPLLMQGGLVLGYSILLGTGLGIILAFLGLFSRTIYLISLTTLTIILYGLYEAKRYKERKKPKKRK